MKKIVLSLIAILFVFSVNSQTPKKVPGFKLSGQAQGTTYTIIYLDSLGRVFELQVDSILKDFDKSCSIYEPKSTIARINKNEPNVHLDKHFKYVFDFSQKISKETEGAFDITVGPLVNAYGFGIKNKTPLTDKQVDSILKFVGYQKVKIEKGKVIKADPRIQIDFNAIAQGYSLDVVAAYFDKKNVKNYLIEIGGEVVGKGIKPNGQNWIVGIDKPTNNGAEEAQVQLKVKIQDCSITTAGSYRKFYEEDGQKYSHVLDPHTGKSAKNNLLSVSIIAKDGITADGYDTALMVMGLERSLKFLKSHPELEAYFIYTENGEFKTKMTPGFEKYIVK